MNLLLVLTSSNDFLKSFIRNMVATDVLLLAKGLMIFNDELQSCNHFSIWNPGMDWQQAKCNYISHTITQQLRIVSCIMTIVESSQYLGLRISLAGLVKVCSIELIVEAKPVMLYIYKNGLREQRCEIKGSARPVPPTGT